MKLKICCIFCHNMLQYKGMNEADIIIFLQSNASVGWITFFKFVTLFGSYLGFVIVFAILFIRQRRLSLVFAVTFVIASIVNHILKLIIMRERPFVENSQIINYGNEDGYSMPSGHSLCGGLFATFLFYHILTSSKLKSTQVLGGIFCVIFPFVIAYSRMVLGAHYLSDTLVGIAVGVIFALVGIFFYHKYLRKIKFKITFKKE